MTSVRGGVVDARFPFELPKLKNLLLAGESGQIVIEVALHLDSRSVHGIALTPTQGRSRGSSVLDTGEPLRAPVGGQIRGRVFNVFGEPIDHKGELTGCKFRSVHRKPVAIAERSALSKR